MESTDDRYFVCFQGDYLRDESLTHMDLDGYYSLDRVFSFFAFSLFRNVRCIGNCFLLKELPSEFPSQHCTTRNPICPFSVFTSFAHLIFFFCLFPFLGFR
jgi:hypothetical protein